jgi:spermidine synthase
VVELSASVVRGAEWFRDVTYAVHERPNLTMLVEDGRNHMALAGRTYDVITADAMFPSQAGSTNLYSQEYYTLARRTLKPGGVMLQWVNQDIPEPEQQMLMRTFMRVFPHVSLWLDGSLLVGSDQPFDRTMPWLDGVFAQPIARGALSQVNIRSADDVRRLYKGDRAAIEAQIGDGLIVTDDHPRVEYFLGLRADGGPRKNMNRGVDGRR